jgi:hypothetical protein
MTNISFTQPFNAAQLELLHLFSAELSEKQMGELKRILIDFKFRMVEEYAQKVAQEKNWSVETINAMSKEHLRTPYQSKRNRIKKQPIPQNKQL